MNSYSLTGLFITGTDTGVGKTQVAAALVSLLAERGVPIRPRKPVESGCAWIDGRLLPADARLLQTAAASGESLDAICPFPLEPALSPERAAALSGREIGLHEIEAACRNALAPSDFLLVEGAGGFYSPLARGALNADLAAALGLPVILVTVDRLGTLGQTLLAVEAIERRGLVLESVVLNRIQPGDDPRMNNAEDLERWLRRPIIVTDAFDADSPGWQTLRPALAPLAERLAGR